MNGGVHFEVSPGGSIGGHIRVPGDKSISHRAIMLGSLAEGATEVDGFLQGEDTLATLAAFRAMGVGIEHPAEGCLRIHGVGLQGLKAPAGPLDLGNSGTSMRLLAGLLAGQPFDSELTGDASLRRRPMRRVVTPLAKMGASIELQADDMPPLKIHGGRSLRGIEYALPMASAQVKSCVLLAGLYARGRTCVIEPAPTRDHTERMLQGFGHALDRSGPRICLKGGGRLQGCCIQVPADISSAAFFMVGGVLSGGAELVLEAVGVNPTRTGVIDILRLMGADIELQNPREEGGEPVADIRVRSSCLHGIEIPPRLVPLAIDEFPAIFIAAACAEGETVLTGAGELRVKESDRIQVMAEGLRQLGITALTAEDGILIRGGQLRGGEIESHGDHRVAMAFAIAALRSTEAVRIRDCANVDTSFPGFIGLAREAGLGIRMAPE